MEIEASMETKLGSLPSVVSNKCCIYKVPTFISEGNKEFYRPLVMSIGPVYYKDKNLETMQEIKWIYLDYFLNHPHNACRRLEPYINFVIEKEGDIRDSYQHQINISKDEFVEMIVLDAAFLVYHFMCSFDIYLKPSVENKLQGLMLYLSKDLFLLENQLPFFVVKGIFYKAFGHMYEVNTFIKDTLQNICWTTKIPGENAIDSVIKGKKTIDDSNIKHLVDLQRMSCCLSIPLRNESSKVDQNVDDAESHIVHILRNLNYTAKQLVDAGVIFVAGKSGNPLDIKFTNGELVISKLIIHDHTEPHYSKNTYFIDYVIFLDGLIDTVEDVRVLVTNKIFNNCLGSDEDVIKLFNNIGKNLNLSCDYYYSRECSDVNSYASTRRHRWMAILRRNYLNHPWVIISVIAAFILFILTLLQTIASFTN